MKRLLTLIALIFATSIAIAQTTPVPDIDFENKLISLGIDTNGQNGNILNSDAEGVLNLNVENSGISDLSGIEAFIDVQILAVQNNDLTSLDLTFNVDLVTLDCQDNNITSMNLAGNTVLTSIICSNNDLTSLDLSNNVALNDLSCQHNQLTSLDLSANNNLYQLICHDNDISSITFPASPNLLEIVWCYNNQLVNLDMTDAPVLATLQFQGNELETLDLRNGNNTAIHTMDVRNNPNLEFICVDDVNYSNNAPNWTKDVTSTYSEDCLLGSIENELAALVVYPNPFSYRLYLPQSAVSKISAIQLIDITGKVTVLPVSYELKLESLPSGMYFLKVEMNGTASRTVKIVKR